MRFETRRARRRREAAEQPFADEWRALLARRWSWWNVLTDAERLRLETLIKSFIADVRWEAANGFQVTDPMRVLIAAQACLLILELDDDSYRGVGTILVHPTTVVLQGQRTTGSSGLASSDPYPILGQVQFGGPVIIAWDAAAYDARTPFRGENVVYHEFAHRLDMVDGVIDGTPPMADDLRRRWVEVFTRELAAVRAGTAGPVLRDYAGENPGEFFAVATEGFFSRPLDVRAAKPELYALLAGFYRQDPAARFTPPASAELPITA
ncbi:MAG TPA: M90 family metallopeptidase [Ilumatobacteraceae bacterium]